MFIVVLTVVSIAKKERNYYIDCHGYRKTIALCLEKGGRFFKLALHSRKGMH